MNGGLSGAESPVRGTRILHIDQEMTFTHITPATSAFGGTST